MDNKIEFISGGPPLLITSPIKMELVHVPAGEFLMGSDKNKDRKAQMNEFPQHILHLRDFYIGKTPVTKEQYFAAGLLPPGSIISRGKKNHPAMHVMWVEAIKFCEWLSRQTGRRFTLPSEAEWEKAARGTDGRFYPWGNRFSKKRRSSEWITTPVGSFSPSGDSPYGCVDMIGNVNEWTRSLLEDFAEPMSRGRKIRYDYPYIKDDGREKIFFNKYGELWGGESKRVVRGTRCAFREGRYTEKSFAIVGFRVVTYP